MNKPATPNAFNKVVSLNGRGRDRSPGLRILAECSAQLLDHLDQWLRGMATTVSEELFVLADATRDRLQQTRHLDLRAAIEKDWSPLLESFHRNLAAASASSQNPDTATGRDRPLDRADFKGLELLDDADLSKDIVIREFAAMLSESCDEELYTLDRRVATLLGHDETGGTTANPLAPALICRALSDACATISADGETRLLLLRRLQRHLQTALPPIYQQLNADLIARDILPDLKRNYRRGASTGKLNCALAASPPAVAATPTAPGDDAFSGEAILAALQRLAQARTVPSYAGTIAPRRRRRRTATRSTRQPSVSCCKPHSTSYSMPRTPPPESRSSTGCARFATRNTRSSSEASRP